MKRTLLKFAIVLAICFAVHILVGLFSSLIVNNFIINTRLANFTIYDGYAGFSVVLAYILLSALLVFNKVKGNVWLIATSSFIVFLIAKVFVIDVAEHYLRFYVKTKQNGNYSFEIFKNQITRQWEGLLWEFSNFGQVLSFLVWVFVALLGVSYFSLWAKKLLKERKLLSQRHPVLYFLAVNARRMKRRLEWFFDSKKYVSTKLEEKLPFRIKKHQSVLLKKLGENNEQLQINKVTNLKIAAARINNVIIKPGETFSFCKLVGLPTKKKGYLLGMELSFGQAKAGIGGGICQISNLIHWLVIHSPLSVTERHHHSFDPFPDDGRVLPFGSGATVFYNYLDYQFTNNTAHTFQINLWFTDKCLEGELRTDTELDYAFHVVEKEHQFLKIDGQFYRKNEIWRDKILKFEGGRVVATELVMKNFARVTYTPENYVE